MTSLYLPFLLFSLLLGMVLYALRLKKACLPFGSAAAALPLSALLGFLAAKLLYVALQANYIWQRWGAASFLRMQPTEFSFFGGMCGVLLGVMLAGKCYLIPLRKNLDAFAPGMALIGGLWKFSEYFLGDFGSGSYVEKEVFQFFPMAITNQYGEWYYAIFMLAGACALLVFAGSIWGSKRCADIPGLLFIRTAFYLALPLILCESLRAECMKWGFVKCEQVLCAVTIMAVCVSHCMAVRLPFWRRFLPVGGVLLIVAGLVGVEFMLDKLSYPEYVGYSIMLILLSLLSALEIFAARRRRK